MPERVQLSRAKGWRMPENTVRVARPGPWGNPYMVGTPGVPDAATAVRKYREWIEATIADDYPHPECTREALRTLSGKNLACWCGLDEPCHADVLLDLAARCEQNSTGIEEKT